MRLGNRLSKSRRTKSYRAMQWIQRPSTEQLAMTEPTSVRRMRLSCTSKQLRAPAPNLMTTANAPRRRSESSQLFYRCGQCQAATREPRLRSARARIVSRGVGYLLNDATSGLEATILGTVMYVEPTAARMPYLSRESRRHAADSLIDVLLSLMKTWVTMLLNLRHCRGLSPFARSAANGV